MSTKAVGISVMLALALVVAALIFTQRAGGPAPSPARDAAAHADTPALSPALVSAISLHRPPAREQRVVRTDAGGWNYTAGRIEWPAAVPETAIAAIAALADEISRPGQDQPPPAGGPVITLTLRDGGACAFRLAPSSIGGRTLAAVTTPAGSRNILIENSILDPLLNPGPAGWRATQAIPGVRDASRITLESPESSIVLARLEGQWHMRRPVSARASARGVALLFDALSDLRALRFEDALPPDLAATGLARPVLTITAERDERTADPAGNIRVRSVSRDLYIGGPADPKGDTRYASADPEGSIVMVVSATAVSGISLTPRLLLHPTPTEVSPGDVFMLVVRDAADPGADRGYRREQGGWAALRADGSRAPADSAPIEELIEFLTTRPGEPEPAAPGEDIRTLRRVEFFDAEGDAQEILNIGYTEDGALAVRAGNLIVSYTGAPAPALLALPAFDTLPRSEPAPPPPAIPEGAPVAK